MRYSDCERLLVEGLRRRGLSIEILRTLPRIAMLSNQQRHDIIGCLHESLCVPFKSACACDDLLYLRGKAGDETPTTLLLEWSHTCARMVERSKISTPPKASTSKLEDADSSDEEEGNTSCVVCWTKARDQMPFVCQHIAMCKGECSGEGRLTQTALSASLTHPSPVDAPCVAVKRSAGESSFIISQHSQRGGRLTSRRSLWQVFLS
jgi:hypothetical protein